MHCVAGTDGVSFHPNLDPQPFDAIFDKGEYAAAYSGFEGKSHEGGHALADWLRAKGVDQVDVCGIATDYCVRATALDAHREGFTTTVLTALTAGVATHHHPSPTRPPHRRRNPHLTLRRGAASATTLCTHRPFQAPKNGRWVHKVGAWGDCSSLI